MLNMLLTIGLVGLLGLLIRLYRAIIWEPKRLRSFMKKQGIDGPPPKFLLGNLLEMKKSKAAMKSPTHGNSSVISHNCSALLFPIFEKWRKQYGPIYVLSLGIVNVVYVHKPDVVKEITTHTSLNLGKQSYQQKEHGPLLGQGVLTSNGAVWSHQRRILAPELYMEKLREC